MQVGYTGLTKKLSFFFRKQLMIVVGLLALPITLRLEKITEAKPVPRIKPAQPVSADPRADRLKKFLGRLHCPVAPLASEFVNAADENQLDWRLLPSISVIESGGGKAYRNNNIFGWDNGLKLFPTIRSGIQEVAYKLGRSALYRNQDVVGKLRLYNPDETYPTRVLAVMRRISPVVDLKPASRLIRRNNGFAYTAD